MLVEKYDNTLSQPEEPDANTVTSSTGDYGEDTLHQKLINSSVTIHNDKLKAHRKNETVNHPGKHLMDISAYSMQGRRTHMEDFFDIGYQLKPASEQRPNEWPYEYFYFGIFDGHGGTEAAKYAKENLLKMIVQKADFWSNDDEDVKRAIREGFADCHSSMRKRMSTWNRANKTLPSTSGTTASVLFIKNGKFYTSVN